MNLDENRFELPISILLDHATINNSDKEVIFDGYRRLNYRTLHQEANALASGLTYIGVKKGDRVVVCLPNWHEYIVIFFAVAKLGAVLVPINPKYSEEKITYFLKDSKAKVIFFTNSILNIVQKVKIGSIGMDVDSLDHLITVRFEMENMINYKKLLEEGSINPVPEVDIFPEKDVFGILYTSGTTGPPKGVMLTHKNLVYQAIMGAETTYCTSDDVFLMPAPLYHVMGVTMTLRTIASCARIVLMETYTPETALSLIDQEKITFHPGIPAMFIQELNHPSFKSYDLSSLRTSEMASAPCPEEIIRRIREEMGCNIMVGYGMTETSPTLTLTDFSDDDTVRSETVGKAWPGVELKVTDEKRCEVAVGEIGELDCRGVGLMKGYYKMPEKTDESIDEDGWFYTGDLVTIDEKGYVRFVARKNELIVRDGYYIFPSKMEDIYYTHPKVIEIAIVGLPDADLGNMICAAIRLKSGEQTTEEEMKAFIKGKVANHEVPDKIVFRE